LIGLYGISIAFSLARLVHGYLAARRLVAAAVAHPLTTLESTLVQVCASRLRLAVSRIPEIRFLDDPSSSPLVIGVRHPVLLLPACLRHSAEGCFNDQNLTAILSHELAHIRRCDYLVNLITRILSLPVAYHPATHALHGRIRQTREMICDAHAAGSFESASTYARSLLAIAGRTVKPFIHIEAVGLFDHTPNTLEERIMNLTAQRLPVSLALRAARIAIGSAVLLAAVGTAATLHIKPTGPSIFVTPTVYAAQVPQAAPTPAPSPAPAPAATPAPSPTPKAHRNPPTVIVDGEVRELTPQEQQKLEKDLGASMEQIQQLKKQFEDPAFKKQWADSMKVFDSADFKKQMEDLKIDLKGLDNPQFAKNILDAQKLALTSVFNDPSFKLQMDQFKLQFDSPEFRAQMEQAKNLALEAHANAEKRSAETRRQLDDASQTIEEVKKQIHDAKIQQQLEQAQRSIENATPKD
jgi:beta-lactamase regulating signal transducer with metallopeptidase domain